MFTLRTLFTQAASAPTSRRERARQVKLEGIIDASVRLVEKDGLEALTIHRLAKELDCAVGGLYRYFPSMSSLHAELQGRIVREYHDALSVELEKRKRDDTLTRLAFVATHYHRWMLARPAKLGLIALNMGDPRYVLSDEDHSRVMGEAGMLIVRLVDAFENAAAAKELDPGPAIMRALAYWSSIQGVLGLRKMTRMAASPLLPTNDELAEHAAGSLLIGWGADAARVRRAFRRVTDELKPANGAKPRRERKRTA